MSIQFAVRNYRARAEFPPMLVLVNSAQLFLTSSSVFSSDGRLCLFFPEVPLVKVLLGRLLFVGKNPRDSLFWEKQVASTVSRWISNASPWLSRSSLC